MEEEESFREITLFTGSWELGRYCLAVPVVQVFRGTEKSHILQKAKNDDDLVWDTSTIGTGKGDSCDS